MNVNLPTGECSGVAGGGSCQLANVVTDIAIKGTGGVNSDVAPGTVVAAIGWRAGARKNADGTPQSEHNGLYRSTSGSPNTFVKLGGSGFTPQERIGRIEFGPTTGASQDKDYLYAIVQDAVVLNGGVDVIDAPENFPPSPVAGGTVLNGIYVSKDFGASWVRMADDNQIAKNPATGSALVGVGMALGFEPGVQAWYNEWIAPDPTRQSATGVPTRLAFGLEEVWQNELPVAQDGPSTFKVIGRYFSDKACLMLTVGLPECPTNRPPTTSQDDASRPARGRLDPGHARRRHARGRQRRRLLQEPRRSGPRARQRRLGRREPDGLQHAAPVRRRDGERRHRLGRPPGQRPHEDHARGRAVHGLRR